jgi:hypothetical protein
LKLSLKNPTDKKISMQLLNVLGQTIYQQEIQTPGGDELIEISMTRFPRGVYWLRLNNPNGSIKILKKIFH